MTQAATPSKGDGSILYPLISAVVITLFLFYIDEGFYNFKWMLDLGNWIIFSIYVMLLFLPQLLTLGLYYWLLRQRITSPDLNLFMNIFLSIGGMIMGLIAAFRLLG